MNATVSVRELNSNISKALSRVEAGETIDITRNGRIIAELRPKRPVRDERYWKAREELVASLRKGYPVNAGRLTYEDRTEDAEL
jgi:antitoxin (DNA-binding transcriptional repressor) of toxin-antitoxin stability system